MPVRVLAALCLLLLAGCPGSGGAPAGGLQVGQRWRFRLGTLGEQVYEVTAVTATDVLYDVRTFANGAAVGEPLAQRFPLAPGPGPLESGQAGAPFVVSGLRLDTWITEKGGDRLTTAVSGRTPRFPGALKVERGEDVVLELVDVR